MTQSFSLENYLSQHAALIDTSALLDAVNERATPLRESLTQTVAEATAETSVEPEVVTAEAQATAEVVAAAATELEQSIRADVFEAVGAFRAELQPEFDAEALVASAGEMFEELEQSVFADTTAFIQSINDIASDLPQLQSSGSVAEALDKWVPSFDFFA